VCTPCSRALPCVAAAGSPFENYQPPASFPLPPALERNVRGLPVRFDTSANQYVDQGDSASSDPTLDPTNPLFRGYAWRVMQEVRSEVTARQNKAAQGKGLSPNFKKYYMLGTAPATRPCRGSPLCCEPCAAVQCAVMLPPTPSCPQHMFVCVWACNQAVPGGG
jgi:hypothetical protein